MILEAYASRSFAEISYTNLGIIDKDICFIDIRRFCAYNNLKEKLKRV